MPAAGAVGIDPAPASDRSGPDAPPDWPGHRVARRSTVG